MERLAQARVAVFGIGGVGGYTVEALARSGVGALDLIDNDTVCTSNLNRQIIATRATIGMAKVDAAEERIRLLYPECRVTKHQKFYLPETAGDFDLSLIHVFFSCILMDWVCSWEWKIPSAEPMAFMKLLIFS